MMNARIPDSACTVSASTWNAMGIRMRTVMMIMPEKCDRGWNVSCFIALLVFVQFEQTVRMT